MARILRWRRISLELTLRRPEKRGKELRRAGRRSSPEAEGGQAGARAVGTRRRGSTVAGRRGHRREAVARELGGGAGKLAVRRVGAWRRRAERAAGDGGGPAARGRWHSYMALADWPDGGGGSRPARTDTSGAKWGEGWCVCV